MNKRIMVGSLVLFYLNISFSVFAQDAKKGNKDDKVQKVDIKNIQASSLDGRIVSTPSGSSIVIQIPYQTVEANKNQNNNKPNNNNRPRTGGGSAGNRNGQNQKQRIQAQIQQQKSLHLVTHWNEVEIPVTEKTKFRTNQVLQAFDDKGNVKRYTSEELKALKGQGSDAKLPGYEAKTSEIEPGHLVRVSLIKSSDKTNPKPVASMVMVIGKDENYKGSGNSGSEQKKKK